MSHDEFEDVSFDELDVRSRNAAIVDVVKIKENIYTFKIMLAEKMKHYPGQYILVNYIFDDKKITRAYTMISSSLTDNYIELNIQKTTDPVTSHIMTSKKIGDIFIIKGPYGRFVWNNSIKVDNLAFIAINIGINPFISFLRYIEEMELNIDITLYYQCKDNLFISELDRLTDKINLKYYTINDISEYFSTIKRINSDLLYICGEKSITNPLMEVIRSNKLINEEKIRLEQWF